MAKDRQVFHSILTSEGWTVMLERKRLAVFKTQRDCEADAIARARKVHEGGSNSQVVFHKEDGVIREERTYGEDPERTAG